MNLTDLFTAQLEREADRCRRALERVPEGRNDWKPHEKSMGFGYLATLVATMPGWVAMAITQDELDLDPPGGSSFKPLEWSTTAELVAALDDAVAKARAALAGTTDEHLQTPWRLLVAGNVVLEDPRWMVIAETFTHLAHHRGQLTVYLRLNEVPVPSIYGPSADEQTFG
ncbi:MAG TPA: DinB family protein [Thermoanaerobaculia bacterium]|nr:DinB family protein [Thermoanaerobaculia bacterium]